MRYRITTTTIERDVERMAIFSLRARNESRVEMQVSFFETVPLVADGASRG